MPCPHNQISIVQRSNRQSAVAAAAYQSGEKLFCEYDQEVKHYICTEGFKARAVFHFCHSTSPTYILYFIVCAWNDVISILTTFYNSYL